MPKHGPHIGPGTGDECVSCRKRLAPGEPRRKFGNYFFCAACDKPPDHGDRPTVQAMSMAQRLVLGPETPAETGTWTAEKGYVKDISETDRAELIAKARHARQNAPRTAWKPGQRGEL
jgi:hypothetical protein